PGTAIKAVDLLSVLLSRRLALSERDFASLPDEPPRLCYQELSLDQLLLQLLGPIRTYGAADVCVLVSLLQAFKNLLHRPASTQQRADLLRHARSVRDTAERHLNDRRDREEINDFIARVNRTLHDSDQPLMPLHIAGEAP
ncbi:MAG: DUF2254 domain-containing protein, partial [Pseudomonas sp.]|nr:DUF2254 domain-containing protein [Pseudomonas sp.]